MTNKLDEFLYSIGQDESYNKSYYVEDNDDGSQTWKFLITIMIDSDKLPKETYTITERRVWTIQKYIKRSFYANDRTLDKEVDKQENIAADEMYTIITTADGKLNIEVCNNFDN